MKKRMTKYQKSRAKFKRTQERIENWRNFVKGNLDRVTAQKKFFYDTSYAKEQLNMISKNGEDYSVTYNLTRMALNRIKTDQRDLNVYLELSPKTTNYDGNFKKMAQSVLNNLFKKSIPHIDQCSDDMIDMSFVATKLEMDRGEDGILTPVFRKIHNPYKIFADCSVHISEVNSKGSFIGLCEYIDYASNKDLMKHYGVKLGDLTGKDGKVEVIYEFEREVERIETMGMRLDVTTNKFIHEKMDKSLSYLKVYKKKHEKIISRIFVNEKLVSERDYELPKFPIIIGVGQCIDTMCEEYGKRLTLVPMADACEDMQRLTNLSSSLYYKFMARSRGSFKLAYPWQAVQGGGDGPDFSKYYENMDEDQHLPYNLINAGNGQKLNIPPTPFPDIQISPVVTQALEIFPVALKQILGVNLEQDLVENMSGEALKVMQVIRHKGAKIFTDHFLQFVRDIGEVMKCVFFEYFTRHQVVAAEIGGEMQAVEINKPLPGGAIQNDIQKAKFKFDFDFSIGASPATNREKTIQSLDKLYSILPQNVAPFIIKNTLPLYASSLDTPDRDLISNQVTQSLNDMQNMQSQGEQQQSQAMQQQQAFAEQEMHIKEQDMEIKRDKHLVELEKAQIDKAKAVLEEEKYAVDLKIEQEKLELEKDKHIANVSIEAEKSRRADVKASAEIIKTLGGENE